VDERFVKMAPSLPVKIGEKLHLARNNFFERSELLDNIIVGTDTAIADKFNLPKLNLASEIKKRIQNMWPIKAD